MKAYSPSTVCEERLERYLHQATSPKTIEKRKAVGLNLHHANKSDDESHDLLACYRYLQSLIPSAGAGAETMSEIELLQHIIDYIQDLQETLASTEQSHTPTEINGSDESAVDTCSEDEVSH
eukprot:m.308080 g.308080  ORF g.308080 m.308080 type:complete len:122 (+) comp43346_c0_seq1:120-485(+)